MTLRTAVRQVYFSMLNQISTIHKKKHLWQTYCPEYTYLYRTNLTELCRFKKQIELIK